MFLIRYILIVLVVLGINAPVAGSNGMQTEGLDPEKTFMQFWEAFMAGDPDAVRPYLKAERADNLTADDLKYRVYYPPLIHVVSVEPGSEGVAKLTLQGTYVNPYEADSMGGLAAYEQRFGQLEILSESYTDLLKRLPHGVAARLRDFVDREGTKEIWLLDIPGRALVVKEDGQWRVDVYHFNDRVMRRTAPRRLILSDPPPNASDEEPAVAAETGL